jgi:hypothetical protein
MSEIPLPTWWRTWLASLQRRAWLSTLKYCGQRRVAGSLGLAEVSLDMCQLLDAFWPTASF